MSIPTVMPASLAASLVSSIYAGGVVPPGALRVKRDQWQRPRWWDYFEVHRLKCPAGHPLKNNYELDDDGSGRLRCNEYVSGAPGGCGLWVWALRLRGGSHLVVEVTERDLKDLSQMYTPSEKLAYLAVFQQLERVR